ncbi:hypothetical protein CUZ56_02552 [Saezia sanguinis]|uniref:Uncharacterized protein n=1 Tax=Saezia sanguinis TaxID=1965230 RepID=A0A433SB45_9BURK|nr:hypothetical protein CUZ56_02552 [Saezia sanguinis]
MVLQHEFKLLFIMHWSIIYEGTRGLRAISDLTYVILFVNAKNKHFVNLIFLQ